MADLEDISTYLAQVAVTGAVYPNGTSSPSVAGMDVRIYEGWPISEQLDLDLQGKMLSGNPPMPVDRPGGKVANVSVYPLPGTTSAPYQVLDEVYTIVPVSLGLSVSQSGNTLTVSGTPGTGEFLTLLCDNSFVYSEAGASVSAILSALATAAEVNYPSGVSTTVISSTEGAITIPTTKSLVARQGGIATLGKVISRQKHAFMVSIWAPSQSVRTALSKAIDVAIKSTIRITLPDTSQALVVYSRTSETDDSQNVTLYRRDLVYDVTYATLLTFPGITVTSTQTQLGPIQTTVPVPPTNIVLE